MNWKRAKFTVLLLTVFIFLPFLGWYAGGAGAEARSGTSYVLTLQYDHLSAAIENLPLRDVLEKLSRLTDIEVSLEGSVGDESVTVEFKNLPLEDGIRRILQGKSFALTYTQTSFSKGHAALPKVVGIRVVPKGAGQSINKESADSVIPFSSSDTRERPPESLEARTREALPPPESATASGLRDQDPKVREAILEKLGQTGQTVPVEPLAEMALTDASPALRMDALELLAEKGGDAALDSLKQALQDPDPGVRGLAQGLLDERRVLAQGLLEELKEKN
jgi:hypothetical protein